MIHGYSHNRPVGSPTRSNRSNPFLKSGNYFPWLWKFAARVAAKGYSPVTLSVKLIPTMRKPLKKENDQTEFTEETALAFFARHLDGLKEGVPKVIW